MTPAEAELYGELLIGWVVSGWVGWTWMWWKKEFSLDGESTWGAFGHTSNLLVGIPVGGFLGPLVLATALWLAASGRWRIKNH